MEAFLHISSQLLIAGTALCAVHDAAAAAAAEQRRGSLPLSRLEQAWLQSCKTERPSHLHTDTHSSSSSSSVPQRGKNCELIIHLVELMPPFISPSV